MLAKTDPKGAVDVYCKFHISDPPTFDDGYILGEIVRLLMKAEDYEDKRLVKNMILYGKVYGLGMTRLDLFMRTSFVKNIVDSLDLNLDSMAPLTKELTSLTLAFYIAVYWIPKSVNNLQKICLVFFLAVLEKYVKILEEKFKNKILQEVYAGVNGKSVDDADMQAFFKFKCWI